jgi:hypothetical protein
MPNPDGSAPNSFIKEALAALVLLSSDPLISWLIETCDADAQAGAWLWLTTAGLDLTRALDNLQRLKAEQVRPDLGGMRALIQRKLSIDDLLDSTAADPTAWLDAILTDQGVTPPSRTSPADVSAALARVDELERAKTAVIGEVEAFITKWNNTPDRRASPLPTRYTLPSLGPPPATPATVPTARAAAISALTGLFTGSSSTSHATLAGNISALTTRAACAGVEGLLKRVTAYRAIEPKLVDLVTRVAEVFPKAEQRALFLDEVGAIGGKIEQGIDGRWPYQERDGRLVEIVSGRDYPAALQTTWEAYEVFLRTTAGSAIVGRPVMAADEGVEWFRYLEVVVHYAFRRRVALEIETQSARLTPAHSAAAGRALFLNPLDLDRLMTVYPMAGHTTYPTSGTATFIPVPT